MMRDCDRRAGVERDDWTERIARARREAAALGDLLLSCQRYLSSMASSSLGRTLKPKIDISDLVQQTLLEAYQGFPCFAGRGRGEFLAWLGRILSNNICGINRMFATSQKRAISREQPQGSVTEAQSVEGVRDPCRSAESRVDYAELEMMLMNGIARLPYHYRQMILFRFQKEYSFADIGRMTGKSEEAVQKLWRRATNALRRHLASPGEELTSPGGKPCHASGQVGAG